MLNSDFFLIAMFVLVGFSFFCAGRIDGYRLGADSMRRSYLSKAIRKEQKQ